jgi:AraC-like DNA-binding protein
LIPALGESFGESASNLSGRTGDEDFHVSSVALRAGRRLEETDKHAPNLARTSPLLHNHLMYTNAVHRSRIAPGAATESAVATLLVYEYNHDMPGVSIPRPEIQLVVRFGPSARSGLDVHAFGVREHVHRKVLRSGQRTVTARLRLGAQEAVLGVSGSAIAGRIIVLDDLWGDAPTRRLCDRLADTRNTVDAAAVLAHAIAERLAIAGKCHPRSQLALDAADRLVSANVNAVAVDLGVSERHLRRVFRETVGVNPKTFAKLRRFHRALYAARQDNHANWASIAAAAGYYDQAHLVAEFRAIAGVTPRALLGELRGAGSNATLI